MATIKQARLDLMESFDKSIHWTMSRPGLKIPWARLVGSDLRVWFKAQSVHYGWTGSFNDARSLHVSIKTDNYSKILNKLDKMTDNELGLNLPSFGDRYFFKKNSKTS